MTLGMRESLPCRVAKQTDLKTVLLWPQVELQIIFKTFITGFSWVLTILLYLEF